MEKLGIIREDVTPVEESQNDKVAFECDNDLTGEAAMIDRTEESEKIKSLLKEKPAK